MIQSCWVQSGRTGKVKAPSSQPGPSADNLCKLLPWHPPSLTQIKSSTLSSSGHERLIHIYLTWSCNRSSRGQRDGSEEPLKGRKICWNLAHKCSSCRYADAVWISHPHIKSVCWWFSVYSSECVCTTLMCCPFQVSSYHFYFSRLPNSPTSKLCGVCAYSNEFITLFLGACIEEFDLLGFLRCMFNSFPANRSSE